MTVLVTGGAGFIGSHVVRFLLQQNQQVRIFDNLSTGKLENIEPVLDRVDLCEGDIRDPEALEDAMDGVDVVIHLAAMISVVQSLAEPLLTNEININGTLNVLEAARNMGAKRFVFASSAAVYGDVPQVPTPENAPTAPLSPYGLTKLMGEQYCTFYSNHYGLKCVSLRFFNAYGPRQDPNSPYAAAVPIFMERLRRGQAVTIYGDGEQSRDFVYVGDMARALWTAATAPGIAGEVFNVAYGEAVTVNSLVQQMGVALGIQVDPIYAPARPGEIRSSCANVEKFARRTGFRANVDLQAGLRQIIKEWA